MNTVTEPSAHPRIAVLLSSYKRPNHLVKQILSMLRQTYSATIFVAVKGLSETNVLTYLIPLFSEEIKSGKLVMRHYPNTSQFNNLLDCYRGKDLADFDLYCKIDDDDIYYPTYLEDVASVAAKTRHNDGTYPGSYFFGGKSIIAERSKHNGIFFDSVPAGSFQLFGNTLCLSRKEMEQLYDIEANPDTLNRERYPFLNTWNVVLMGFVEDALFHRLIMHNGGVNRYDILSNKGVDLVRPQVITTNYGSSVIRGGLYPNEFYQKNARIGKTEKEWHICLFHPGWNIRPYRTVRLFNGRVIDLHDIDHGSYATFDGTTLVLKWDRWGTETFIRDDRGVYCKQQ